MFESFKSEIVLDKEFNVPANKPKLKKEDSDMSVSFWSGSASSNVKFSIDRKTIWIKILQKLGEIEE